jgi:hypothetical protein
MQQGEKPSTEDDTWGVDLEGTQVVSHLSHQVGTITRMSTTSMTIATSFRGRNTGPPLCGVQEDMDFLGLEARIGIAILEHRRPNFCESMGKLSSAQACSYFGLLRTLSQHPARHKTK